MHLDLGYPVTLTGLAAAATDVKTESAGLVASGAGFLRASKEFPDRRKDPRIGGRVRARCSAYRALVDIDAFVELFKALNALVCSSFQGGRTIEGGGGKGIQRAVDER